MVDFGQHLDQVGVVAPRTFAPDSVRVTSRDAFDVETLVDGWFVPSANYDPVASPVGKVIVRLAEPHASSAALRIYFDIVENGSHPPSVDLQRARDIQVLFRREGEAFGIDVDSNRQLGLPYLIGETPSQWANFSYHMGVGDFDRDGDLDVASWMRSQWSGMLSVLEQGDDLGFSDDTWFNQTSGSVDVCIGTWLGDFDRDDDLDVITAQSSSLSNLWQNDGSGVFQHVADLSLGLASGMRWGSVVDYDDDGLLDLVFGTVRSKVYLSRGTGSATLGAASFEPATVLAVPPATASHAIPADFDRDGDIDLITTGVYDGDPCWYYERLPGGALDAPVEITNLTIEDPDHQRFFSVFDEERDGVIDLLVVHGGATDEIERLYIARGNGDGTFSTPVLLPQADVLHGAHDQMFGITIPTYLQASGQVTTPAVASSWQRTYDFDWSSGTTFPADYSARARLIEQGVDVARASDDFTLTAAPEIAVGISTDRTEYGANQDVRIASFVENTSTTSPLADLPVAVTIEHDAVVLTTFPRTLASLLPGERRALDDLWTTGNVPPGTYTARIAAGAGLGEQVTIFDVVASTSDGRALIGTLVADPRQVEQPTVNLAWTATNIGNVDLTDVDFSVYVITDPSVPTTSTPSVTLWSSLATTGVAQNDHDFVIAGLVLGHYVTVLEATYAGVTQELARATFQVMDGEPPVVTLVDPTAATLCALEAFDVTVEVADALNGVDAAYYRVVGALDWTAMALVATGPPDVFDATIDVASIPTGTYVVEIAAVDTLGNDGRASGLGVASFNLFHDPDPPEPQFLVGATPLTCDGTYYTSLVVDVTVDGVANPATHEVLVNGTPVVGWEQGVTLAASGDYTIEVRSLDPAQCLVNTTCGPVHLQILEIDSWIVESYPRVLLYDSRPTLSSILADFLVTADIYHRIATNEAELNELYRSGVFDVVLLRSEPSQIYQSNEIDSQVFKQDGVLLIKLNGLTASAFPPVFGVLPQSTQMAGLLETIESPLTGDEDIALNGMTMAFLRTTAQMFGRQEKLGAGIPSPLCQGTTSMQFALAATVPAGAEVDVTASDRFGVVDSEAWGAGGDAQVGERADLAITSATFDTVAFSLSSPDGYRLDNDYDVTVAVTDSFVTTLYSATLPSACGTLPGPVLGAPGFSVVAGEELSIYGNDAPEEAVFIAAVHRYGLGRSVTLGFDIETTGGTRLEQLLVDAIDWLKTQRGCPLRGYEVAPVQIEVRNLSPDPADVEVVTSFVSGASLVEPIDPTHAGVPLTHRFSLLGEPSPDAVQSALYLIRLAPGDSGASSELAVDIGGGTYTPVTEAVMTCTAERDRVEQADYVIQLIDELSAIAFGNDVAYLATARNYVVNAQAQEATANTRMQIDPLIRWQLLPAVSQLDSVTSVDAGFARIELGQLIRMWQIRWYEAP